MSIFKYVIIILIACVLAWFGMGYAMNRLLEGILQTALLYN
jgi:hypothetical protein